MDVDQRGRPIGDSTMTTTNQFGHCDKLTVSCDCADAIVGAINELMPKLPKEVRRTFNRIKLELLHQFGKEGLFERVNNQTVASVLEAFDATGSGAPIERGELEGVKYELYEESQRENETQ